MDWVIFKTTFASLCFFSLSVVISSLVVFFLQKKDMRRLFNEMSEETKRSQNDLCSKTMNINEQTVGQVKEIQGLLGGRTGSHPYKIGKNYFIRTVTHHLTGRLVKVTSNELVLEDAAWIADDGRFHKALKDGELSEVEPFPNGEIIVGRGSLIDCCEWLHALPRNAK